jgi:DNA-binding CsgD family transcriptional regulator
VDDAREGHGRVVLVEAAAGIGKTSLLQAASEQAGDGGFRCLHARASELERDFAYGCVRQLLEPVVARSSDAVRPRRFAGAAALSEPLFSPASAAELLLPADTSFSMLHGLYWLLNNLADESPLLLAVDDLHWADAESLRFANYLAPRLEGLPLVLLASMRTGEKSMELARLAAGPETAVLHPGPLSRTATAELCAHRLGDEVAEPFAAACWEATGGNPFFLETLLREAGERGVRTDEDGASLVRRMGPAAVADAILLGLSRAPAAASALVRSVAVLGDGATLAETAALTGVSEVEAAGVTDLLARQRVLRPGPILEFAHPIVREAVYTDIGPRQRAEAHGRAAGILAAGGATEERIAAQIAAAEPVGDAGRVELLRRVAAAALARGAPTTAVSLLRRALAEPPPQGIRGQVLVDLGRAELRIAAPEAVGHLAASVDEVRDPELLAMAARLLGNALSWMHQSDRAVAALESAIRVLEPTDPELALVLESDLAAHAQLAGHEARAPVSTRLERHAGLHGDTRGERLVLASLDFERARASTTEGAAVANLQRAFAAGRLVEEQDVDVPPTIYTLLVGVLGTDALDLADAVLHRMLDDARTIGSVPAVAFVLAHHGLASVRRGAVARAEADARVALDLLTGHEIALGTELALAVLLRSLVEGGALDEAERSLQEHHARTDIRPGMPTSELLEARAVLRLAQGRTDEGLEDLLEFGRRDELWGGVNPMASRWRSRACLALAALGDAAAARRMALEDLDRARRWDAASGIGVALRACALVHGGPDLARRLQEAVEVLAPSPARLEHARALVDLGGALRRSNRRREARRALHDGLDLAERCGARALADQARTELRAAGGRARTTRGAGVDQLTASERRVAELAAEGLSNPEIAQALFVTRKTVETHLGSVYRKLAVSGRGRLRRALTEAT